MILEINFMVNSLLKTKPVLTLVNIHFLLQLIDFKMPQQNFKWTAENTLYTN